MLTLHNINRFIGISPTIRVENRNQKFPNLPKSVPLEKKPSSEKYGKYDGTPHGGFYTRRNQRYREICRRTLYHHHPRSRSLDICSALAAYPGLGCTGDRTKWQRNGCFRRCLCPKDSTFIFLKAYLPKDGTIPSPYIHIGGDECPKSAGRNVRIVSDAC